MKRALIVLTKVPIKGLVKTRLIPALAPDKACELQRRFLLDILDLVHLLKCQDDGLDVIVSYTPPDKLDVLKDQVKEVEAHGKSSMFRFVPQSGADLGERSYNAIHEAFRTEGCEQAVMIGTDLPTLPLGYLKNAFDLLEDCDVVLGPNVDGGYYLVGMRDKEDEIFSGIDWGTKDVLRQTLEIVNKKGLKLGYLDLWYDVDEPADLRFLKVHLEYLKTCGKRVPERTYRYLKRVEL